MCRFTVIGIIVMTFGLCPRDARADWYSDVREIIEQVIETNVSTEIIPNAAARVPALCSFFPSSLAAIQAQRYTGLQTVLRKEVADAVGCAVFRSLNSAPHENDKAHETDKALEANKAYETDKAVCLLY